MYQPQNPYWRYSIKVPTFHSVPVIPLLFTFFAFAILGSFTLTILGLVSCMFSIYSTNRNVSLTLILRRWIFRMLSINFRLKRIF